MVVSEPESVISKVWGYTKGVFLILLTVFGLLLWAWAERQTPAVMDLEKRVQKLEKEKADLKNPQATLEKKR